MSDEPEGSDGQVVQDEVVLDFDVERHMQLRQQRRLGLPLGTLPSNPQQNAQLGAPFAYDPAQYHGTSSSAHSIIQSDLTARGYFVVSALRHGFDYVLYEGDPSRHHGSHFVIVTEAEQSISPQKLVLWHRLAASAHKAILISSVVSGLPSYWMISGEER
ncbi:unnamed protein product [Effrenium voratum]|uniref:tRNA-intron lyase n=1 Tax=Effrenium voratum TaxID=2562239 RepID=A0AA36JE23_9DINO|nr:unnamed protein product [Effrenium voratum]CAJ1403635.1 unnamed protein product [Effrenium voratum]CAJ1412926.1 unnamed protein product [Effrenium voratum]